MRKQIVCISDHVRHKAACTVTKADEKLEILDLRIRVFVLISVAKIKALISFAVTAKLICAFSFAYVGFLMQRFKLHISC